VLYFPSLFISAIQSKYQIYRVEFKITIWEGDLSDHIDTLTVLTHYVLEINKR